MEEDFIPYEEARLLKGLGFNEECMRYHWENSDKMMGTHSIPKTNSQLTDMSTSSLKGLEGTVFMSAPLYQQAFRWFRENYDLYATPNRCVSDRKKWSFDIWNIEGDNIEMDMVDTYEDAELACLRKLIEIVKEKYGKEL